MIKKVFFVFLSLVLIPDSQLFSRTTESLSISAPNDCFTKIQLMNMQSSEYTFVDVRGFLTENQWSFSGAKTNSEFNHFRHPLDYDIVLFENSSYRTGGKVVLYTKATKAKIVIVHLKNKECFFRLMEEMEDEPQQTFIESDMLFTLYRSQDVWFEFRERTGQYENQYSVLVYEREAVDQELNEIDTRLAIEEQKTSLYQSYLTRGDSLLELNEVQAAKSQFTAALSLYNTNLVQQKLENVIQIEKLQQFKVKRKEFDALIESGDSLLELKDFVGAKVEYMKASLLFDDAIVDEKFRYLENTIKAENRKKLRAKTTRLVQRSDSFRALNDFENAIATLKEAKSVLDDELVRSKMQECLTQKREYERSSFILAADAKMKQSLFLQARKMYLTANEMKTSTELSQKILESERKLCFLSRKTGDSLAKLGMYNDALREYKEHNFCLSENKPNITQANLTQQVLRDRKTKTFLYRDLKPENYKKCTGLIQNDLMTQLENQKSGHVRATLKVNFDTNGNGFTHLKDYKSDIGRYDKFLKRTYSAECLTAPRIQNLYVSAIDSLLIDISWSVERRKIKYTSGALSGDWMTSDAHNSVLKYLSSPNSNITGLANFPKGRYNIDVKQVSINGGGNTTLIMSKYHAVGRSAALNSLVLPGWGKKRVTYGEKGTGTMITFLSSSAIAVGSRLYSMNQYQKYKDETIPSKKDEFFTNANSSNKVFLVAGGLSATIYVTDVLWVLNRGKKNKKATKAFRKQLHKTPFAIHSYETL